MGTIWHLSNQVVFDNNGLIAPGARAYFYDAGTSTPKPVYEDGGETTVHTSPVEADGNGRWPAVFVPFGNYKTMTTTASGSAIGSTVDNIPNPEPFNEEEIIDATTLLQTGDIWFSIKNSSRSGAVRCNGRTIGSEGSGATERAHTDTEALFIFLWSNLSNTLAPVSGGRGPSASSDFLANKRITLPDMRGTLPVGLADMGSTALTHLDNAPVVLGSTILGGSILGANTHLLLETELTSHSHAISFTSGAGTSHSHGLGTVSASSSGSHTHGVTDPQHTHTLNNGTLVFRNIAGAQQVSGSPTLANLDNLSIAAASTGISVNNDGAHTHSVTGSLDAEASHTHAVLGSTNDAGSDVSHNNLPRTMPGTFYIKL